ncbi:hypothetical protein ACPPVO_18790 [Dactylosporangium sp. McL0621]|uniref:hypothetical protein n=1 Tax=Dactylosporangium sp. McL0621 TaxID=3415678 RepID=UPI003CEF54DE
MVDDTSKQAFVHAAGAGGAWAAVLTYGRHRREVQGGEPGAPADRMALTAVVAGLECLTRPTVVEVRVHSDYVRGGGEGGLWDRLRAATRQHEVSWAWSGDYPELTVAQDLVRAAEEPVAAAEEPTAPVQEQADAQEPAEAGASLEDFVEALGEHVANDPDAPDPAELVELAEEMVEDEHRAVVAVGRREITFEQIGAVAVPPEIAAQARTGWRVLLSAALVEGNWYLLDVAAG